jgi:nucleotide-binding universal stress UspA family protein
VTAAIAGRLNAALRGADVAWEFVQRDGRPVTQIARVATPLGADAVIVGASRRRAGRLCLSTPSRLLGA